MAELIVDIDKTYILERLKKGYVVKDIAREWAKAKGISLQFRRGEQNPKRARIFKKINQLIFGHEPNRAGANRALVKLLETNQANRTPEVVQRQFSEFIKNNHKKYVGKAGGTEKLYADAVKWFEKNNPGAVLEKYEGITTKIRPGQKIIQLAAGQPGSALIAFRKGKKEIKKLVSPASRTRKPEMYQTRIASWEKAAESLGMTRGQYQGMLQKNMIDPLKRLFPQLIGTKYVPGVEHMYGLRQAIATGLMKEIKKAAKNVAPSPTSFNYGVKGTQLDKIVTPLVENAFNTQNMAERRGYIKTANRKIAEFKSEYPGKYPKYVVDKVGNIKDVNMGNINLAKQSLNKQATQFIDYLNKTPGFKGSVEFKGLPETTQTLIQSRAEKLPQFHSQLRQLILTASKTNKGGVCNIFRAEGGRIGFAAGSSCVAEMETALRTDPIKTTEQISRLPGNKTINSLKTAAGGFLKTLGRGGLKAAPLAALAAAGAAVEPLVKQFRNDDPNTYLTNEGQMKGMLLATIEGETPKVDEEILKWQYPGIAAGAATAVPGSKALYKARTSGIGKAAMGAPRAALGPVGKVLAGTFSPLAVAATLPLKIAAQRAGGSDYGDIATDPTNWMGPAFASAGADWATKGMKGSPRLANAIRLGFSPNTLRVFARRFGLPGLAVSAGMWGYDKWKNRSVNDED